MAEPVEALYIWAFLATAGAVAFPQPPLPKSPEKMKKPQWLKKRSNDEPGPSSGRRPSRRSSCRPLPPPPRAQDFVEPQATGDRRRYVTLLECMGWWAEGRGCDNRAVSLPAGWHLNPANVSVPPLPQEGTALQEEMRRCIKDLPTRQRVDLAYQQEDFWREFLAWEQSAVEVHLPWRFFIGSRVEGPPLRGVSTSVSLFVAMGQ
jgi:hypothetical protein